MWNVDHVKIWLTWAVGQFNLEGIDVENFNMTGQDLCSLEHEHFVQLIPNDVDNIFWTHLELLRKCKFVGEYHLTVYVDFPLIRHNEVHMEGIMESLLSQSVRSGWE